MLLLLTTTFRHHTCFNGLCSSAVLGFLQEAPQSDLLLQLLSHILRLCPGYSFDASASSSSPPASSLSVRPLTHSDSLFPRKHTQTHVQTQPQSDSLTIRLAHNQFSRTPDTHTDSPTFRLTHSGHSHTEIPAHSAYSCSYSYTQGIPRGSRQRYLQSQPDYSHSDSPNFKLTHTQADSYSKQHILMWQA